MSSWLEFLARALADKRAAALLRVRGGQSTPAAGLDFGSNDYLGLATHPEVLAAARGSDGRSTKLLRFGSGASPVLSGYTPHHATLEAELARLSGTEAALVFSSGYGCNVGALACLASQEDLILSDALNHASLIDGCRLSKAQRIIYPHNDIQALESLLQSQRTQFRRALLVTESIFSMDGDAAPLKELSELCQRFDVGLVVDEAHATGMYGEQGGGLVSELGLQSQVLMKLGTLSKALGGIGGYACGSSDLVEYLVNHCRSYLFSTAPPVPVVQAVAQAVRLLAGMSSARRQLRQHSQQLRRSLQQRGWSVPDGDSPIVPVLVGSENTALELSQRLAGLGLRVPAIRPPTVPRGTSRLRISLSSQHSGQDIQHLLDGLGPVAG